jgi:FMN phosphatase YigB (HAD superfamily)
MIEAVIFDVGGVLAYDVWEHLLLDETEGVASLWKLDRQQVESVGRALWGEFSIRPASEDYGWRELEKEYWREFLDRLRLEIPIEELINLSDSFIRPVDGMVDLIGELKEQFELAICSDNTEFWFQRQMDKLGLYRFFKPQSVVLSSRIGASKLSPGFEMFRAAVRSLGMAPSDCIMVDDRQGPIVQAIGFGLGAILFPSHAKEGAGYLRYLLQHIQRPEHAVLPRRE